MALKLKPNDWIEIETAAYSGRLLTSFEHSKSVSVFTARSLQFKYREAEGHCLIDDSVDSLQSIRTQISRGRTSDARLALELIASDASITPIERSEVLHELARIHMLHGEWQACIDRSTEVLQLPIAQVTKLTTLQCGSVAYYELGLWSQAMRDIDQVLSIATLFPLAPAGFYAQVLKIKIGFLDGSLKSAERGLEGLWSQTLSAPNLDRLLTLFRLEADIARIRGLNPRRWSLAAFAVATEMGDELYAALARLELWAAGDRSSELETLRQHDLRVHPRVLIQDRQLASDPSVSTTTKLLAQSVIDSSSSFAQRPLKFEAILIPSRQLILHLDSVTVVHEPKSKKIFQALAAISLTSQMTKADLFRALYGDAKYVAHLHDATLAQLLSRARKRVRVRIEIGDGVIRTPGVWSV